MVVNSKHLSYENVKKKISNRILLWSFGKEKYLNIISPPYNSSQIFVDTILKYVENNKKVLYITNEKYPNVEIIAAIKNNNKFRGYTYLRENSEFEESLLIVTKYEMLSKINSKFDLIIYDDIKIFSKYKAYEVIYAMGKRSKENSKFISYSIEKNFPNSTDVIFPVRYNSYPLVEPKFIDTRIDINKDIPYMVYEYLKWELETNLKKIIVYVPNVEKVKKVYKYLTTYCATLNKNILHFSKDIDDKKTLQNFLKVKQGILITDDVYFNINNINVMVFFANDKSFNYKKLVYLSGKAGLNRKTHRGEVIFLGNCESDAMCEAKNIMRYFNKEAWEMNLLKI